MVHIECLENLNKHPLLKPQDETEITWSEIPNQSTQQSLACQTNAIHMGGNICLANQIWHENNGENSKLELYA